jgi:hypothetical protein
MVGHHLILGELIDFITGETLEDTHDERYRQNLARLLVEKKGYAKNEIEPRCELLVKAGDKSAIVKVDFKVFLAGRVCMIIKYGPGSIVTRHRPALAASRLVTPYQVPVVVVTNGEDAEVLDGATGKVIQTGLNSIPSKMILLQSVADIRFKPISVNRVEMESRIVYAYEVDGSCPCDDTICRL